MKRAFASLVALGALSTLVACKATPPPAMEDKEDAGTVTDEGARVTEGEDAVEGQ